MTIVLWKNIPISLLKSRYCCGHFYALRFVSPEGQIQESKNKCQWWPEWSSSVEHKDLRMRMELKRRIKTSYYYCIGSWLNETKCYSTDSERPHRCCHLPIKVGSIDRTPNIPCTLLYSLYSTMGQEMPTKLPFLRGSKPSPNTWFLGPTGVHIPNNISVGSCVSARLMVATNGQTDRQHRPRYICSKRSHIWDAAW